MLLYYEYAVAALLQLVSNCFSHVTTRSLSDMPFVSVVLGRAILAPCSCSTSKHNYIVAVYQQNGVVLHEKVRVPGMSYCVLFFRHLV